MGLKIAKKGLVMTKEEEDALFAENRKAKAEGEFVILLEDKKRVAGMIDGINNDIQAGKDIIEKNNQKINETNEEILKVQGSLREEKQYFEEYIKQTDIKKSEINEEIKKIEEEKEELRSEILSLSKKHDLDKFEKSQEIKELETRQEYLKSDIKKLEDNKEQYNKDIVIKKENLDVILGKIQKANEEKLESDRIILSLNNQIEDLKGVITNTKTIINQQDITKQTKEAEIVALDTKIEQKEKEYKEVEPKAFMLLAREEALEQKEAFIKSQYDRAGIKWEQ